MAATRAESAKPAPEPPAERTTAAAPEAAGGGLQAWLPLAANLVLMPVLAFATFHFLILPQLRATHTDGEPSAVTNGHTDEKSGTGSGKAGGQLTLPLGGKVLVNVAGTMGTRYLLAQLSLVSSNPDLKALMEKHDAALRDAACSALSVKTIADLEKPGARNLIRTELISVFNNILGDGAVSDIYLTEFAIQ